MAQNWVRKGNPVADRMILPGVVIASFVMSLLGLPLIRLLKLQSLAVCPFRTIFGFPCPTCGYTRVFYLVLNGQTLQAFHFQPFIFLLVLWSGVAAVLAAMSIFQKRNLDLPRSLIWAIWVTLGCSWIWNLTHNV